MFSILEKNGEKRKVKLSLFTTFKYTLRTELIVYLLRQTMYINIFNLKMSLYF